MRFSIQLIFSYVLKMEVAITSEEKTFLEWEGIKLSYTYKALGNELRIVPFGLLHQNGIEEFDITLSHTSDYPYFFKTNNSNFGFDLFSASFFLATRYEEYWPHKRDQHNRFSANQSTAFKNQFLHLPVINLWANELLNLLKTHFGTKIEDNRSYALLPTIDVDSAFAYREKGLVRTAGAYARSIFQGKLNEINKRTQSIIGTSKDPYDVFDRLIKIQKKNDLNVIYFFLVGNYGLNDKNVAHYSQKFQALIKHVNDYSTVALHPSFASNTEPEKVKMEKERLSQIVHNSINQSRQHFLIIHLPTTYRNLINAEIEHDYSMGYPEEPGFRASICSPYPFYDLELEQETNLMIHPFCFMEATYKYYKKENFEEIKSQIKTLSDTVKKVKGEFCILWHNDSLSETHGWENWSPLFEEMIEIAKE